MPVSTSPIILTLVELRVRLASQHHPFDERLLARPCTREFAGLIERGRGLVWLTAAGWELAERMIAAADDQLTLWRREQAGTLSAEDAERRRVA